MQFVNSISKLIQFGLLHSSVPRLLLLLILLKAWRPFSCECNIAPAVGGPNNLDVRFGPRHKCLHGGGRSLLRSPRWVLRLTPLDNFLAFSDQRKERDGIVNSRKYLWKYQNETAVRCNAHPRLTCITRSLAPECLYSRDLFLLSAQLGEPQF